MNLKRQAAPGNLQQAWRAVCLAARDEGAVTAIEYALLASLIAVLAMTGIAALGSEVERMWQGIAQKVVEALTP